MGDFVQSDPIGFASEDFNIYRYVANDPINRSDPSGNLSEKEYKLLAGGAVRTALSSVGKTSLATLKLVDRILDGLDVASSLLAIQSAASGGGGGHGNSGSSGAAQTGYSATGGGSVKKVGITNRNLLQRAAEIRRAKKQFKVSLEFTRLFSIPASPGARRTALELEKTIANVLRQIDHLADRNFHRRP